MDNDKGMTKPAALKSIDSQTTTILPEKVDTSISASDTKPFLALQSSPAAPTLFAKSADASEKDVKGRNRFLEVISAVKNKKLSEKLQIVEKLNKACESGADAVDKVIMDEKIDDVKTFLIACETDVDAELSLIYEKITNQNINMPDVVEELKKQKTKYGFEMIFNVLHSIPGISYLDNQPNILNEQQAILSERKALEWLLRHVQAVGFLLLDEDDVTLSLKPV